MNPRVLNCQSCGGPIRVVEGQFVLRCGYCQERFLFPNPVNPAVVLKPRIGLNEVKQLTLRQLRDREIDPEFLANSYFEKATLFFIPFYEIRGIRAGKAPRQAKPLPPPGRGHDRNRGWQGLHLNPGIESGRQTGGSEYVYSSFQFLEKANDLKDLGMGVIDFPLIEDIILKAEPMEFQPAEMRRLGVLLSPNRDANSAFQIEGAALPVVEYSLRTIYFPVWEIGYSFAGILFKSYLSAVDGTPLKIQAIKNHDRNLLLAIAGVAALAILLTRTLKLGMWRTNPLSGMFLLLFVAAGFITWFLFPYFWELFAHREIIEKSTLLCESRPINYSENSILHAVNFLLARIGKKIGWRRHHE